MERELNTGELRNLAFDCELNLDWENAAKNYALAIERYPTNLKMGALYERDMALLKAKLTHCLETAKLVRP